MSCAGAALGDGGYGADSCAGVWELGGLLAEYAAANGCLGGAEYAEAVDEDSAGEADYYEWKAGDSSIGIANSIDPTIPLRYP